MWIRLWKKINYRLYLYLGIVITTLINTSVSMALPLSPGDRIEVSIPNEKYFSRVYEVNEEGNLEIPYLGAFSVTGREPSQVKQNLVQSLVEEGFFLADTLQLTVQVIEWSPIQVSVQGELFLPGTVLVNQPLYRKDTVISPDLNTVTGEFPYRRYVTDALAAAGGILPTAKVNQIRLIRNGTEKILDLSGALTGEKLENVPLIAGDKIIVPSAERFQAELVRPSAITRPGIEIFTSNQSIPTTGNASSALDFPYGSRFSQVVIALNCAGGTGSTNANRRATLVRTARLTGESIHVDRKVEELMRNSHNYEDNPLLMPGDGVACYDSSLTNAKDMFDILGAIINPFKIMKDLFD